MSVPLSGARLLSLEEVLRRSHREELLPLAQSLGLWPIPKGRDALARKIATTLRRSGVGELQNLMQHGWKGPPYAQVVDSLARRLGMTPAEETADTEALLLRWFQLRGAPSPSIADRLSKLVNLDALEERLKGPPPDVSTPIKAASTAISVFSIFHVFFPLLAPVAGLRILLWLLRPRDEALLPAILGVAELREKVDRRFVIGLVGPPSVGKDAAIKALFGVDTGNVSPVAGSTRSVCVFPLPVIEGLEVVNTPGVGDVIQDLTDETRGILDHVDAYLFLVNSQGGVRQREKDEWGRCAARRRPALVVVNKIDTLRERDRERFLADVATKLGVTPETVVGVAFDPLPQLSPRPIGVERVTGWLADQLRARGKKPEALWPDQGALSESVSATPSL